MKPGIFEIFLLSLIPTTIGLRLLPALYAVVALFVGVLAIIIYTKYIVFGKLKGLNIPHDEPTLFLGDILTHQKKGFNGFACDAVKRHGKIFGSYFGPEPWIFVADANILRDILVKDFHNFTNKPMLPIFKESDVTVFSNLLLSLVDDKWRNTRGAMSPAFTTSKIKQMIPLMNYCIENLAKTLNRERVKNAESAVGVKSSLGGFTLDVILTCGLGKKTNSAEDPNNPLVVNARKAVETVDSTATTLLLLAFPYTTTKLLPRLVKKLLETDALHYVQGVVLEILKERRQNPQERVDMLHLLVNAHEDNDTDEAIPSNGAWNQEKHFLTDDEIAAQLLFFLVAGSNTTATVLTFCLYTLATNCEAQQKCFDEIESAGELTYEALQSKLPYLDAVISETLRIFPPQTMEQRETRNDYVTANGVRIPAGTTVAIPIYAIHYMEEYYPDPHTFNPDRFNGEEKAKRNPLTYLPFGYGPRSCLGIRFVLMEIKLTLATLLKQFHFSSCAQTEIPLSVVDAVMLGSLEPKKPIWLTVSARGD